MPNTKYSPNRFRPAVAQAVKSCGIFVLLLFSTAWLGAAVIVDWGGNYVSSNQSFANPGTNQFGGFVSGDPLQLSPASNYSGGAFYGMVSWTTIGTDGEYGRVVEASGGDRIEIKRYNTDLQALVLWRQSDFLNGLDSGTVAFDSTSKVSMNLITFVQFDPGRVVIRLSGGSQDGYYISQQTPFDGSGLNEADLTSLTWLAYDPASDLGSFGAPVNLLSGGLISNVTEVGFYAHSDATSANAFRLDSFEVTAIPEPSSSLLILSGLAFFVWRRPRASRQ